MRSFWPPADAAQADYESAACSRAGRHCRWPTPSQPVSPGAAWPRSIARPVADPIFVAVLRGRRPGRPWSPYADPRLEALGRRRSGLLLAKTPTRTETINEWRLAR